MEFIRSFNLLVAILSYIAFCEGNSFRDRCVSRSSCSFSSFRFLLGLCNNSMPSSVPSMSTASSLGNCTRSKHERLEKLFLRFRCLCPNLPLFRPNFICRNFSSSLFHTGFLVNGFFLRLFPVIQTSRRGHGRSLGTKELINPQLGFFGRNQIQTGRSTGQNSGHERIGLGAARAPRGSTSARGSRGTSEKGTSRGSRILTIPLPGASRVIEVRKRMGHGTVRGRGGLIDCGISSHGNSASISVEEVALCAQRHGNDFLTTDDGSHEGFFHGVFSGAGTVEVVAATTGFTGVLAGAGSGGGGRGATVDDEEVGVGLEAKNFLAVGSGACTALVGGVARVVVGHGGYYGGGLIFRF
mmetsp:Transcript_28290/g.57920  ORF Transcript_28290/g.57920 Transcript_28290/m.57920 type:complete len:355 (-) Transcript_28290:135-1199(-)